MVLEETIFLSPCGDNIISSMAVLGTEPAVTHVAARTEKRTNQLSEPSLYKNTGRNQPISIYHRPSHTVEPLARPQETFEVIYTYNKKLTN